MVITRVWTTRELIDALQRNVASGQLLLMFFSSEWCATCQAIEAYLNQDEAALPNVQCLKLVTDESPQVAADYAVDQVPTVLTYRGGRATGVVHNLAALQEIVQEFVAQQPGQTGVAVPRPNVNAGAAVAKNTGGGFFSGVKGWFGGLFGKRKIEEASGEDGQGSAKRSRTEAEMVDQDTLTCKIRINLSNGKKLLMSDVPIAQRASCIRDFILVSCPKYKKVQFKLMNSPPTKIINETKTIQEEGLANSLVIQHSNYSG